MTLLNKLTSKVNCQHSEDENGKEQIIRINTAGLEKLQEETNKYGKTDLKNYRGYGILVITEYWNIKHRSLFSS